VAAEIDAWNPSFDVTPARLIEGIVTERGLVPKAGAGAAFGVRAWMQELGLLPHQPASGGDGDGAAVAAAPPPPPTVPGFVALDVAGVKDYVAARPQLAKHVGSAESAGAWEVQEVGDGNLNFVFIVQGPAGALCVKQAPPYVRVVGEGWPLSQARVRVEAAALALQARHCPAHVPALLHFDGPMCLLAMEFVPPPHIILRRGLVAGETYPRLAGHLATLLAATLFNTSRLALAGDKFRCAQHGGAARGGRKGQAWWAGDVPF
jgi:5-methylthioribose kinase